MEVVFQTGITEFEAYEDMRRLGSGNSHAQIGFTTFLIVQEEQSSQDYWEEKKHTYKVVGKSNYHSEDTIIRQYHQEE